LIILANSGDSGIILAIQGGPGAALGGYRLGLRAIRTRKRPPPWVERGGRRQAKEGLEGVAASVREGSAILALLVLAGTGLVVLLLLAVLAVALATLLLLLLTVLVVALAALLLLAILVVAHAALLAGTLPTLLLLAALLTGALAALLLLAAALALLVLVAVLIVVSHDQASSLNCVAPVRG
jgi:hypothetical protein